MSLLARTKSNLTTRYQTIARRLLRPSNGSLSNLGSSSPRANISTDALSNLRQEGIIDENNLLQFSTLHELQINASLAFSDNPLFGTYKKKEGREASFEFMTYKEFGGAVDKCRTVLKDLGKCWLCY